MKTTSTLLLAAAALYVASCTKPDNTPETPANTWFEAAEDKGALTTQTLQGMLSVAGFTQYIQLLKSDVKFCKAVYYTEHPQGNRIKASGLFLIPSSVNAQLPTVIYTHGTAKENEAPSVSLASVEVMMCAVMSSSFGCVTLMPDYVGYGESAGTTHPYIHKESVGQACLDFVRAYKEFADAAQQECNSRLFITGYSEGGYAAVALQQKIQETSDAGFAVAKVVAGAGPYDNVAFAKEFLATNAESDRHFVASYLWALQMYKDRDCYGYAKAYSDIFSPTADALLSAAGYDLAYFHPENLSAPLPSHPLQLLNQAFIDGVLNGTDTELLRIFNANSLVDFVPQDSLIFVYGSADKWVPPSSSINAYNAMKARSGKVAIHAIDGADHSAAMLPYCDIVMARLMLER